MTTDGLPTGQAARKLGVTPQLLRQWTARYGWPPVVRTAGGQKYSHRRYSLVDIERLAACLESHQWNVHSAIMEARHGADVVTVCPYCRRRVGLRLLVRTRQVEPGKETIARA